MQTHANTVILCPPSRRVLLLFLPCRLLLSCQPFGPTIPPQTKQSIKPKHVCKACLFRLAKVGATKAREAGDDLSGWELRAQTQFSQSTVPCRYRLPINQSGDNAHPARTLTRRPHAVSPLRKRVPNWCKPRTVATLPVYLLSASPQCQRQVVEVAVGKGGTVPMAMAAVVFIFETKPRVWPAGCGADVNRSETGWLDRDPWLAVGRAPLEHVGGVGLGRRCERNLYRDIWRFVLLGPDLSIRTATRTTSSKQKERAFKK
ncbi:hypothetical protein K458DRAFT_53148 [Lentithecium fluviatile CBS 122367]|uniref:Secreted protein n=1 Tax=Lentithecium fluviatile CBS 122367 TaxID=1168545 RepID=A0A6G1IXF9_9PLEO|nr:hypothetical protein K458DRAFT_53148 [Lentithecium fluviatile CBS 122367]